MTQGELANAVGMSQNNLSRLENPDYGKHTLSSLKRIADALDVALIVRFVPFSQYIDWLSSTPRIDYGLTPDSLAVSSYDQELQEGVFNYVSEQSSFLSADVFNAGNLFLPPTFLSSEGYQNPLSTTPFANNIEPQLPDVFVPLTNQEGNYAQHTA